MESEHNRNKRKRSANRSPEQNNAPDNNNNNVSGTVSTTGSRKRSRLTREEAAQTAPHVTVIPNSSQVIDLNDSDDDEIPYTHSRSQSPLFVSSSDVENEATAQRRAGSRNIAQKKSRSVPPNAGASARDAITIDDDDEDDMRDYYVISDEEEEEPNNGEDGATQKTVSQQLTDNVNISTSNMNSATCAVCFDAPERTFFLPCGHLYCEECVFKALSSIKTSTIHGGPCALCRAYTPYNKVRGLKLKKKPKILEGR